ncbi:MAG: hypothetical protein ACOYXC_12615 [Candidatus Rifleibacteriota bacterium]
MLKPQDILIILKIVAKLNPSPSSPWFTNLCDGNFSSNKHSWNFASLAEELCMSSSEVHAGFKRAVKSKLIHESTRVPNVNAIDEFFIHGLKYVFPAELGEITRGIPTAHAAPPLNFHFLENGEPSPVWPYSEGSVRGQAFKPLYKSAPKAALKDPVLYELLAIIDALRGGRARERKLAVLELHKRLGLDLNVNFKK